MKWTPADDSPELTRRLDAAPELVFAAFADPALVRRWLRPSPEVGLEVLSFDFRIDGGYRFAYSAPGRPLMHVNGAFLAIEPPSRLVFSWNIEPPDEHAGVRSEVRVSIASDGEGAVLHIAHVKLDPAGAPQRHAAGWAGALELLAALIGEGRDGA